MINELYNLDKAIAKAGITTKEWHPRLKELRKVTAKAPFFKIALNNDGSVGSIEEITNHELISKLRKWEPNNGFSFPVFNMPPMFTFSEEELKQKSEQLTGKKAINLSFLNDETKINNGSNDVVKLRKNLNDIPVQLKEKLTASHHENHVVLTLINYLTSINVDNFKKSLITYAASRLNNDEDKKVLLNFLLTKDDVQVILDIEGWQNFGYPVASENSIAWLNEALIKADGQSINEVEQELIKQDAFGNSFSELGEKMPEVKLAGELGGVKLRSMFRDHLSQYKYKLIEDESYPINKENRTKIKSALEWLKDDDRQGKTWGLIDPKEILFAYPSFIPDVSPKIAGMMIGSSGDSELDESSAIATFESLANDVKEILHKLCVDKNIDKDNIQLFAIRKMDKSRSKIVYFRNYTTEKIIEAAQSWQEGCKNLPPLTIKVWPDKANGKEKNLPERREPLMPFPLQIANIVNTIWKQSGEQAGKIKKVKYTLGLELMLEQNNRPLVNYLLSTLVQNIYGLVVYLGNKGVTTEKNNYFPALLGLLLYQQKRVKEDYMKSAPYLLGQMLKISDELHAFYCKVVRGDVPPQLAGNSFMATALEAPERMLGQLGQRMNPYVGWAKTYRYQKHEDSGLAGWYLKLYEDTVEELKAKLFDLNTRFGDSEKAELFIGYLASFPKKERAKDGEASEQDSEINEEEG